MHKPIFLFLSVAMCAMPASADFQWELGASYLSGDFDSRFLDADIDVFGVNGSWYFEPVDDSEGPLSEAAFSDRSSSVNVSATDGEIDLDFDDIDISSYEVNTRWVFNREAGWLVDLGYEQSEADGSETDSYTVGGGKYIFEETLLTLSYTYSDPDSGGDTDAWELEFEHSAEFGPGHIKIEASYEYEDPSDGSDVDSYLGRVIYYPRRNIGVGADYERVEAEGNSDNWSLFGRWFITEDFAVILLYQDFESTGEFANIDGDAVVANALLRF